MSATWENLDSLLPRGHVSNVSLQLFYAGTHLYFTWDELLLFIIYKFIYYIIINYIYTYYTTSAYR